jgi:hypothetical protein
MIDSLTSLEQVIIAATALSGSIFALFKALKPVAVAVTNTLMDAVESRASSANLLLESRVSAVEASLSHVTSAVAHVQKDIAATNGDPRSISDRLDTTKYATIYTHRNVRALAEWLGRLNPDAPPLTLLDPPHLMGPIYAPGATPSRPGTTSEGT